MLAFSPARPVTPLTTNFHPVRLSSIFKSSTNDCGNSPGDVVAAGTAMLFGGVIGLNCVVCTCMHDAAIIGINKNDFFIRSHYTPHHPKNKKKNAYLRKIKLFRENIYDS